MKKYSKPIINVIMVSTCQMLAASGDTTNVKISNSALDGVTFNGHEDDGDWEDEGY